MVPTEIKRTYLSPEYVLIGWVVVVGGYMSDQGETEMKKWVGVLAEHSLGLQTAQDVQRDEVVSVFVWMS